MSDATRPPTVFEAAYAGVPPWDVGHAQAAMVALVDRGGVVRQPVLDVGCGTGEHVLLLRSRGIAAWGVDIAAAAIERARGKARARGVDPSAFVVGDALALERLGWGFATTMDTGVFHVFSDADRALYAASLSRVLVSGGAHVTLVFSDREPADWGGPRRIRERDFADAFREGWRVRSVEAARLETNLAQHAAGGGHGWLAILDRPGSGELQRQQSRMMQLATRIDELRRDLPRVRLPDRFHGPIGLDDDGNPFPLTRPLPPEPEQLADNERVIAALERELRSIEQGAKSRGDE